MDNKHCLLHTPTKNRSIKNGSIQCTLHRTALYRPGPKAIKLFSCSTQLSTKFQLIKTKIRKIKHFLALSLSDVGIYHANKCLNAKNCWHFNIYEQDKFHAQLS